MLLLDKILEDIGDPAQCKQLRPFDLKFLGYYMSDRKIPIGNQNKRAKFNIFEMKDMDNRRSASFCYLYGSLQQKGIVLPHSFDHYVKVKKDVDQFEENKKGCQI